MVVSATEVTILSPISASAAMILASEIIPIVQDRITMLTNNYFTSELQFEDRITFDSALRTLTTGSAHFEEYNFLAGDDIMLYGSYRNDGYYTILSVNENVATLVTGSTIINELSGQSILLSVVQWPKPIKYAAAQMIYYDVDIRPTIVPGYNSGSLGPFSESYSANTDEYGYPKSIMEMLVPYRMTRLM